jgi:hypothetical protein
MIGHADILGLKQLATKRVSIKDIDIDLPMPDFINELNLPADYIENRLNQLVNEKLKEEEVNNNRSRMDWDHFQLSGDE